MQSGSTTLHISRIVVLGIPILRRYSFSYFFFFFGVVKIKSVFIYHKEYFYDKILKFKEKDVLQILKTKGDFYYQKEIPKKGGSRILNCLAPDSELRTVQENITNNILKFIPIPSYVYGFKKGFSYKHYLIPHTQKEYYLRVDIQDFFHSIKKKYVIEVLKDYFKSKEDLVNILEILYEIISIDNKVPQGAITSPYISNIVFRSLDIRIYNYCKKFNITYTRYADDMLFSSNNKFLFESPYFIKMISKILRTKHFKINNSKLIKQK